MYSLLQILYIAFISLLIAAYAAPKLLGAAVRLVVSIIAAVITGCIAVPGTIGDYFYQKARKRDGRKLRLPWYYRWRDWRQGRPPLDAHEYEQYYFYDKLTKMWVSVYRPR